jgi:endonuclease YncB( thermonuclease family)
MAVGTLGNPIEKQTRYGQDSYAASVAYYRTQYDMIGRAEKSGELTRAEAEDARLKLAEDKPWNMAGKSLWTFAPASAAFLSWQAGNLADHFNQQVEVGRVTKVLDGDTIELASGKIVRMMGVDTPESVHPTKSVEYLGPEASAFQKKNLTGKTVKLVTSPGAEVDKYGRDLAYIETLPGFLDAALNIPLVGKYLPAADQNKRMIELGYGQPRYLELSGGHERQVEYDKALVRAREAGVGVHSPEGLEELDYHYRTPAERRGQPATAPASSAGSLLGSGLMVTGQSGLFKHMGAPGNVAAQTWNAALAALGAQEYNAKAAARPSETVFRPPKAVKTEYEKQAQEVLDARRRRNI